MLELEIQLFAVTGLAAERGFLDKRAVGGKNLGNELLFSLFVVAVVDGELNVHIGLGVVGTEFRGDVVVAYGCLGRVEQIHFAENTADAEHVLTFQVVLFDQRNTCTARVFLP